MDQCYISKLPLDIFDAILELSYIPYLSAPDDFPSLPLVGDWKFRCSTLALCSRVNKAWQHRANTKLYDEVRLHEEEQAKKFVRSRSKLKHWKTTKLSLRVSSKWAKKVVDKCMDLKMLEIMALEGFEVDVLGSKRLANIDRLVLLSPAVTVRETSIKLPFLRPRTLSSSIPAPKIPFTLKHLWYSTECRLPADVLLSIILPSLPTLEMFVLKGDPDETSDLLAKAMSEVNHFPRLESIRINDGFLDPVMLSALQNAPRIRHIMFEGGISSLLALVGACKAAREEGTGIEVVYTAAEWEGEEAYDRMEKELKVLKELGVNTLMLSPWDGMHYMVDNGYEAWFEVKAAQPRDTFRKECERVGIKYKMDEMPEWKVNEENLVPYHK